MKQCLSFLTVMLIASASQLYADPQHSVVNTKHNLSITGPGDLKSMTETRVCAFCHTPHHASPDPRLEVNPLWSHKASDATYTTFTSTILNSSDPAHLPGQPTGTSRLCLSCHDGSVALGMRHNNKVIGGLSLPIPADRASDLGTDLSNDHPVSFPYDSTLYSRDLELQDPILLAQNYPQVRLEKNTNFVQCTTCHDPHSDPNYPTGKFLVIYNYKNGTPLCTACHVMTGWGTNIHAQPTTSTWADGCENCHRPHGLNGVNYPPLLMTRYDYTTKHQYDAAGYDLCLRCHSDSTLLNSLHPEYTNFSYGNDNLHYAHVVTQGYPCIACHPSHGVPTNDASHAHLINFSPLFVDSGGTYDSVGKSCTVTCHPVSHLSNPKYY